jgi:hypothetical protein
MSARARFADLPSPGVRDENGTGELRLAELVAALSLAVGWGLGQPMGHVHLANAPSASCERAQLRQLRIMGE